MSLDFFIRNVVRKWFFIMINSSRELARSFLQAVRDSGHECANALTVMQSEISPDLKLALNDKMVLTARLDKEGEKSAELRFDETCPLAIRCPGLLDAFNRAAPGQCFVSLDMARHNEEGYYLLAGSALPFVRGADGRDRLVTFVRNDSCHAGFLTAAGGWSGLEIQGDGATVRNTAFMELSEELAFCSLRDGSPVVFSLQSPDGIGLSPEEKRVRQSAHISAALQRYSLDPESCLYESITVCPFAPYADHHGIVSVSFENAHQYDVKAMFLNELSLRVGRSHSRVLSMNTAVLIDHGDMARGPFLPLDSERYGQTTLVVDRVDDLAPFGQAGRLFPVLGHVHERTLGWP